MDFVLKPKIDISGFRFSIKKHVISNALNINYLIINLFNFEYQKLYVLGKACYKFTIFQVFQALSQQRPYLFSLISFWNIKIFAIFDLFFGSKRIREEECTPAGMIHSTKHINTDIFRHGISATFRGRDIRDIPRETVSRCIHTFYFSNVHTRSISTDDNKCICV